MPLPQDHSAVFDRFFRCCRLDRCCTDRKTGIWSFVMPIFSAGVAPPGADRERRTLASSAGNDHSSTARALLDVQTMPPCRPQNAFEARGRIDIRHRREVIGVNDFAQVLPGRFDLVDRRHIGHRAAGGHVRQKSPATPLATPLGQLLRPVRQNVRRLGHEMHAAKHDRAANRGCRPPSG